MVCLFWFRFDVFCLAVVVLWVFTGLVCLWFCVVCLLWLNSVGGLLCLFWPFACVSCFGCLICFFCLWVDYCGFVAAFLLVVWFWWLLFGFGVFVCTGLFILFWENVFGFVMFVLACCGLYLLTCVICWFVWRCRCLVLGCYVYYWLFVVYLAMFAFDDVLVWWFVVLITAILVCLMFIIVV